MLNIKAKKQLRSLAHDLKAIVSIGKKGKTDNLLKEIDAALLAHELIKIQFQKSALDESEEMVESLCKELGAQTVEVRGHVATIYRPHPEKPRITIS